MSGKKHSDFKLDRERSSRENALSNIRLNRQQIARIQHQLGELSHQISLNLTTSLPAHQRSQAWLVSAQQTLNGSQHLAMSHPSSELTRAATALYNAAQDGSRYLAEFTAQINTARQRQQTQSATLTRCTTQITTQEALLRRWQPHQWDTLQKNVDQVRQQLANESLEGTDKALQHLQSQLQAITAESEKQEAEQLRQENAREFFALRREVQSLTTGIEDLISHASPGLKVTFTGEVEQANHWKTATQVELEKIASLSPEADVTAFQSALQKFKSIHQTGEAVFVALETAFTVRATQLRQQIAAQLNPLESLFSSAQDVLYLWFSSSEVEAIDIEIKRLRGLLDDDHLLEIHVPAQSAMDSLQAKLAGAEAMEAKHTRRLFLLDALRRVCGEMGFGEVSPPAFEREGDRSSRIRLQVDTYDKGLVTFHLSLENIEADSCIHDGNCPNEFERLSQHLQEKYGVQTEFKMADGTPTKKLLTDDGARLPDSQFTEIAHPG